MGKRVVTTYSCDLCGSELGALRRQVSFGRDGVLYTLDVCDTDADSVAGELARWSAAGRTSGRYRTFGEPQQLPRVEAPAARRPERSAFELASIRRWAREQGINVSERGRVARSVIDQFEAARTDLAAAD